AHRPGRLPQRRGYRLGARCRRAGRPGLPPPGRGGRTGPRRRDGHHRHRPPGPRLRAAAAGHPIPGRQRHGRPAHRPRRRRPLMRPSLRQAGALAVSIALLAGLPYVATALPTGPGAGWDAATAWAYLRGGALPPGAGSLVLTAGLWGAWGLYALALVVEVAARLAGRAPRRRLLGPLQIMAATAIGATLSAPAAHAAT